MKLFKSFASDNYSGVSLEIMQALHDANVGDAYAYGEGDSYTDDAIKILKSHFGQSVDAYFVFAGTGANVVGLQTIMSSYQAIICVDTAHINVHECGAVEKFIGCKLLTVPSIDGKLTIAMIESRLQGIGSQHYVQPKVISITQSTEMGTVYTPEEIKALANFAHAKNMYLHMDGARLCNAASHLNLPLAAITTDVGVDVLSLGGTKNGMMMGEAVIFFDKKLSQDAAFVRRQALQLSSKMRFIAVQFSAMFGTDLWKRNAEHANKMAQLLAQEVFKISSVKISQKVQGNAIFAMLPARAIKLIQEKFHFYEWDEHTHEVRWMTAWNTQESDVLAFAQCIKDAVESL